MNNRTFLIVTVIVVVIVICLYIFFTRQYPHVCSERPTFDAKDFCGIAKDNNLADRTIPRILHQTGPSRYLSRDVYNLVAHNLALNPEYEYRFYDDDDVDKYIRTHYPDMYPLYMLINPEYGPAKADMFRYLVLLRDGGVYLDIKSKLTVPLDSYITDDTQYIAPFWEMESSTPLSRKMSFPLHLRDGEYANWIIISKPGHPILQSLVSEIKTNISTEHRHVMSGEKKKKMKGKDGVLWLTGPYTYTTVIFNYMNDRDPEMRTVSIMDDVRDFADYSVIMHHTSPRHYSHIDTPVILKEVPKIPKIIYMTYKNSDVPQKVFDNWKRLSPEYEIKFFDDDACMEFLEEHFGQSYASYFKEIPYGPIKSDFWRLCALYITGGVYSDIDIFPQVPLSSYIRGVSFFSSIARDGGSIFQAVVATAPRSPIIAKCIEKLYDKRGKDMGYWDMSGTQDMFRVLRDSYLGDNVYNPGTYYVDDPDGTEHVIRLALEVCPTNSIKSCRVKYNSTILFYSRYEDYESAEDNKDALGHFKG